MKPVRIWSRTGVRTILAAGNANDWKEVFSAA
jgi:hypothetical protein